MTELADRSTGSHALQWVTRFNEDFNGVADALADLDRQAGDGDFGTNLASALRQVTQALPAPEESTYATVFAAVTTGFLATGGTSGPLFGMWFREMSRSASAEGADVEQLAQGVAAGLANVQRLGGAQVGDNTMVDALAPAARALTDAADGGMAMPEALKAAADAARAGARSTVDMVASRGRASYVGDLARGVQDPGAVAVAMFFEAGAAVAGVEADARGQESVVAELLQ